MTRAIALDASTYARSALHAEDCAWVEKNCYIDVWIEVVHALGLEPLAMLGFVAAVDFEDDQFTFFKPRHEELYELYGLEVEEMNPWRTLADHCAVHLAAGRLVATEADAWWLPDTSGTDYRTQHTKTTIIVNDFDPAEKRLGYFHNASYHVLGGEDFDRTFEVIDAATRLPLFAEIIKTRRLVRRTPEDLRARAKALLARHVARRPAENPVARFAARITADVQEAASEGMPRYHAWAFATIRQLGASMELLARHLRWLGASYEEAAAAFEAVSSAMKTLIMKGARSAVSKKPLDAATLLGDASNAWQRGMDALSP